MNTKKTTEARVPLSEAARRELEQLMADVQFNADHADLRRCENFTVYVHPWPSLEEHFEALFAISAPHERNWDLSGIRIGLQIEGGERVAVTDGNGQARFQGLPRRLHKPFLAEAVVVQAAAAALQVGAGEGLTPRLRRGLEPFLKKMVDVAPLMLETVDLAPAHAEDLLGYLGEPAVYRSLRRAEHVRDVLGEALAGFCRSRGLQPSVPAEKIITRNVMDNILWQVAVHAVRLSVADTAQEQCLEEVAGELERSLADLVERPVEQIDLAEPAERTVHFAMGRYEEKEFFPLLWARVQLEQSLLTA